MDKTISLKILDGVISVEKAPSNIDKSSALYSIGSGILKKNEIEYYFQNDYIVNPKIIILSSLKTHGLKLAVNKLIRDNIKNIAYFKSGKLDKLEISHVDLYVNHTIPVYLYRNKLVCEYHEHLYLIFKELKTLGFEIELVNSGIEFKISATHIPMIRGLFNNLESKSNVFYDLKFNENEL